MSQYGSSKLTSNKRKITKPTSMKMISLYNGHQKKKAIKKTPPMFPKK